MKTKETYAVAKSLLEKYGETVTPEVRPSPTANNNTGMSRKEMKETSIPIVIDVRQRVSIKSTVPNSDKPPVSGKIVFLVFKSKSFRLVASPNIGQLEPVNPQTLVRSEPVRLGGMYFY